MANNKQGLAYYNVDTDRYSDRRIKRLKKAFGGVGIAVYDYILCEVYRDRGCVLEWDEDTAFDVADYFGLKENLVHEIVKYCGAVGLFNQALLTRGIITSASIQRRYLDMCARAKRKDAKIPEEWAIIPEELPKITEEWAIIPEVCDKVKKIKEKKIKENNLSDAHACATEEERERFLEIFTFVLNFVNPQQEVDRFIAHYEASEWCRKDSTVPVKNKEALAKMWKPKTEGERYPEEVRQWLFETYGKAKASDTVAAAMLLRGIDRAVLTAQGEERRVRLDCSHAAMNAVEKYFAYRPAFKVWYKIPN